MSPLVLPLLVPLTTAVLCLVVARPKVQRVLGLLGALALLVSALALLLEVHRRGIQAVQIGNWPAPFGITFVADHLSALMVVAGGVVAVAVALFALAEPDLPRERLGYYPLSHFLLFGVNGAFLTGDIFNMYVWFEVLLLSSFVLMVLGSGKAQLAGGVKYFAVSLFSSVLFLVAVGLLYGSTGALNLADLATRVAGLPSGFQNALAMLFLVAFGLKAAVFPFFFWLPASYPAPPVTISALFAGLLTKVGVYALLRVFTLLFAQDPAFSHGVILWVAGLTLLLGAFLALAQGELRRLLSFQLVSHIGYMLMGLGLLTPLALAGSVFYALNHMLVISALFLLAGLLYHLQGTSVLVRMGGLYRSHPGLALLFLLPAFSLAGLPPFSGFWAKFTLAAAGLEAGAYAIVGVALLVGLLTLLSMGMVFAEVFWKTPPEERAVPGGWERLVFPVVLLAVLTLGIGLWAEPLMALSQQAARELLEPTPYIQAVLGVSR
ncbi:Na(+)/H(+) antiporter subunit D [Meiothermus luteus]|uniref:Na(+)/H(+) antiporter subunit D n=1 Tax=Meiothermus luteus TaxID=2026184 RepID=A0A399F202_9DEIN|nr:proton-conducting transporter membrane subunit [Meiothermus luteus]RIH90010.1 Na(+)/H(+) antiporter subunit D [Meiothermus luteus]RMH53648.1 MAG: Na+/H+ antiporter subunit D [Deinococcota bacterium]